MKKKTKAMLAVLAAATLATNVYAEDFIYGENIPEGKEMEYSFKEKETIKEAYKDLTLEKATELKVELEKSGYTKVTINSYDVKTGEIEGSIEEKFDSLEDAEEYMEALKKEGITVTSYEFTNDTKQVTGSMTDTYGSLEELEEEFAKFKDEYQDAEKEVEDVRNYNDSEEIISETETSLIKAEERVNEILALNNDKVIATATKEEINENINVIENAEESYDELKDAQDALEALSDKYDVVDSAEIVSSIAGEIKSITRVPRNAGTYNVTGSEYVITKHGREYYVWTPTEVSEDAKAKFRADYRKLTTDNAVNPNFVDKAEFIYGFDTPLSTENGGDFEFNFLEDGTVTLTIASKGEAQKVFGMYTPITEHVLVYSAHDINTYYVINGNITTLGFDYKLTANGTKEVELDSGVLTANTKKDEMTTFYSIDLEKSKYEFVGGIGAVVPEEKVEFEEINPETGDSAIWAFTCGAISLVGCAVSSMYLKKKEEN